MYHTSGTSHSPMYPQATDSSGSHPGPTPASPGPLPGEFGELDQTDFEHFMQFIEAQSDSAPTSAGPGPSRGPPVHFTINRPYGLSQLSPNDSSASFAAHTSASSTSSLSSLLAEHLEGIAALLKRPGDQHSYNSLVNILSQPFPSATQSPIPPLTLPQFRAMYPVFGSLLGLMSAFAISAAAERPRHDFYILYAVLGQRDTLRVVALDAFRETVTSYTADIKNPAVEQPGFNYTQLIVEHLIDEILSEFHQMDGNVNTNSFLTDYGFKLPLHETNTAHNCQLYRVSTKDGQFLRDQKNQLNWHPTLLQSFVEFEYLRTNSIARRMHDVGLRIPDLATRFPKLFWKSGLPGINMFHLHLMLIRHLFKRIKHGTDRDLPFGTFDEVRLRQINEHLDPAQNDVLECINFLTTKTVGIMNLPTTLCSEDGDMSDDSESGL